MAKKIFGMGILALLLLFGTGATIFAQETTLFDSDGNAVAYIAADRQNTIFLWNGTPVAYLHSQGGNLHIYGFNGQHLGWFANGLVRDNNGHIAGATRQAHPRAVRAEPAKSAKRATPARSAQRAAPARPAFSMSWSRNPLSVMLSSGSR